MNQSHVYDQWLTSLFGDVQEQLMPSAADNELYVAATSETWRRMALRLVEKAPAHLTTMFANDERQLTGFFAVYAVFAVAGKNLFVILKLNVDPMDARFPSLTSQIPAAHWYEREIKDLFGLAPIGHPDPRRLVLHADWPHGTHPLCKDFASNTPVARVEGKMQMLDVQGEGVFEVPVGPIHAGIIEPGHFRFSVVGENVLNLEAKLFYTHRGIEKMCEGMTAHAVLPVAERICGACSLSHAVAYAQALEAIAGVTISQRARVIRSVGLELERLYNHIGDMGNICAGVGFAFGNMQFSQQKEEIMVLNERFTGNRFLHNLVALGGVARDISAILAANIRTTLNVVEAEFREVADILLDQSEFQNRIENTGILAHEIARDLAVVGPAARASGINGDWRRDYPYAAYGGVEFTVPVYYSGDVAARLKVRIDETLAAISLVRAFLNMLEPGALAVPIGDLPPYHYALGYVESARGSDVHWIMTGEGNTIYRYMIRSASYPNWPSIAFAVPGNIVPDFPLINKSYELCYACLDR